MKSLISFFEEKLNQKIQVYRYENQELKDNQELVTWNNEKYIIELIKDEINIDIKGYFYLIHQTNCNFNELKEVLKNLFDKAKVIKYKDNILLIFNNEFNIDNNTPGIVEMETYSKTYMINMGEVKEESELIYKIDICNRLLEYAMDLEIQSRYIYIKDIIFYDLVRDIYNKKLYKLIFNNVNIDNIDNSILEVGISFIENGFNISKTASNMYLHRNTLIYRLEKINELFNIDIKNFYDAMYFYLGIKAYLMKNIKNNL